MRNRKFILLILSAFLLGVQTVYAQKEVSNLIFVYIAHDRTTPSACLSDKLEDLYEQGMRFRENAFIFYLANENQPKIVTLNLPNDNSANFEKLILEELNGKISHSINIGFDTDSIVDIFNHNDFIDEMGKLKYESVIWDFYVGEQFWNLNFHETLISRLHWVMGFNKLKEQDFDWRIWGHEGLIERFKNGNGEQRPISFGIKNLANINNEEVYMYDYSCK